MCAYGYAYGKIIDHTMDTYTGTTINSKHKFVLLFSTLGYELNATKRALLRTIEPIDPNILDANHSTWRLLDSDEKEVMTGQPVWLGVTFGVQLWEIDFSNLRTSGFYRISVDLKNREGARIDSLSTLPFEVRSRLFFTRTFFGISIRNDEARKALLREGGGLYDCNSTMGEASSHGIWLAGLVNAYVRRAENRYVNPADRGRLVEAADRAVDYLMLLYDDSTGEIEHEYPSRHLGFSPKGWGLGPHNTQQGLFGLVSYLDLFREADPFRTKRLFSRVLKSAEYLEKIGAFPDGLKVSVYYHLFKYSGNKDFKNTAVFALNNQLENFGLRQISSRGIPSFEGLYHCVREFKDDQNYSSWIEKAKEIDERYFQYALKRNGFHIMLTGGESDEMPSPERVPLRGYWNCNVATLAIDAIFLAEITGDHSLEKISSAALGWIMGLNPGAPGEMTTNPPTDDILASAAFMMNLDARHVKPWSWWEWTPTKSMMSIVNGLIIRGGKWAYVDEVPSAETFIMHDGAYLYAICVYEDYLSKFG